MRNNWTNTGKKCMIKSTESAAENVFCNGIMKEENYVRRTEKTGV